MWTLEGSLLINNKKMWVHEDSCLVKRVVIFTLIKTLKKRKERERERTCSLIE